MLFRILELVWTGRLGDACKLADDAFQGAGEALRVLALLWYGREIPATSIIKGIDELDEFRQYVFVTFRICAMLMMGEIDSALQVIRQCYQRDRDQRRVRVIELLCQFREFGLAREVCKGIDWKEYQDTARSVLAITLSASGDYEAGRHEASQIGDEEVRLATYSRMFSAIDVARHQEIADALIQCAHRELSFRFAIAQLALRYPDAASDLVPFVYGDL
jgi:hypothetical protein